MSDLNDRLAALAARIDAAAALAADEKALDDVRVTYLGRSGEVTVIRRSIGELPPAERPHGGQDDQRCRRRDESRDRGRTLGARGARSSTGCSPTRST